MLYKFMGMAAALFLASAVSVMAADVDFTPSTENTTYTGAKSGSAPNNSGISTGSDSSKIQSSEMRKETSSVRSSDSNSDASKMKSTKSREEKRSSDLDRAKKGADDKVDSTRKSMDEKVNSTAKKFNPLK